MFNERLLPFQGNLDVTSPSRLAKVATSNLQDAGLTDEVWTIIHEQCQAKRNVEPFFRFIEMSLIVCFPTHLAFCLF
jgi:hypothetical protein